MMAMKMMNDNNGGNNNSKHVSRAYQVPDTVLRVLYVLTHLILSFIPAL